MNLNDFWNQKEIRLNLGSGKRKKLQSEGWINIDFEPFSEPDLVWDVRWGLPFRNDSVDEFYISHVMEHLTYQEIIHLMKEIWRCGKKEALVNIIVPHYKFDVIWSLEHESVPGIPRFFDPWLPGIDAVANFERITLGFMFFKNKKIIEDIEGKIHPEPQIYFTLEVDKSNA